MLETSKFIYTYLLTVPVFFLVDMVWLGVVAKKYYAQQLGELLSKNVNWTAATVFYLSYIFGIMWFAVLPGLEDNSLKTVILNGALFGGLAYATYDLTNLATLKDWPTQLVFVDIAWGIVLSSVVGTASYYIALWIR